MTVHDLVGQCLMVGVPGAELDADFAALLGRTRIGNVVLFARSTPDPATTAALTAALRDFASRHLDAPMLVAVDQEGGRVQRLVNGAARIPSAMALAAAGPEHVRQVAAVCGAELAAVGINLDLAPVADVNTEPANPVIGLRSFGDDPARVGEAAAEFVAGLHAAGVLACVKHFPGHGGTPADSHVELPILARTARELDDRELLPFRAAIAAGVDCVMVGHLAVPALDPSGTPASLSAPITTGLLRETMGWDGLIVTDSLEMGGAGGDHFGERAVRAFLAGCDLLTIAQSAALFEEAARALVAAVESGLISRARLRLSVDRVAAVKARLRGVRQDLRSLGSQPHLDAVTAAARAAVTCAGAPIGVREGRGRAIAFSPPPRSGAEEGAEIDHFLAACAARGLEVRSLSHSPGSEAVAAARAWAAGGDFLLLGLRRAWLDAGQTAAVHHLCAAAPTVAIALLEPYDLAVAVAAAGRLASYGDQPLPVEAALDVALRGFPAPGRLPVSLPQLLTAPTRRPATK